MGKKTKVAKIIHFPREEQDESEFNRRLAKVYLLAIKRYQEHNERKETDDAGAENTNAALTQPPNKQATG